MLHSGVPVKPATLGTRARTLTYMHTGVQLPCSAPPKWRDKGGRVTIPFTPTAALVFLESMYLLHETGFLFRDVYLYVIYMFLPPIASVCWVSMTPFRVLVCVSFLCL